MVSGEGITNVIKFKPIQHISRTNEVHLFVECSFAEPVFRFTAHINRKPSLTSPSVARYCEFGLNARLRTPNVCSDNIDKGTSSGESLAVEKIKTRGLYPV